METLRPSLCAAAIVAAGTVAAAQARTARPCPDWIDPSSVTAQRAPHTCACPPGLRRHSAYGVYRYSVTSHVCTAAIHDGRVGLRGGNVTLYFGPGCAFYRESWRNGIQARRAGPSKVSFAFRRPLPPCTPPPPKRPRPRSKSDAPDGFTDE